MTDSNAKLIQLQELAKAAAEQVAAQQGKSEPVPHEIVELVTTCQALLPELTKALQDYQNQVKNLQADVTSAEEKATDYEVEILAAHQDRDQALDKLEKHTATQNAIEAFVNARPEYVTALKNTRGDDPKAITGDGKDTQKPAGNSPTVWAGPFPTTSARKPQKKVKP